MEYIEKKRRKNKKKKFITYNWIEEKKFIKDMLEEIISKNDDAIINPYDVDVDKRIKDLMERDFRYTRLISSIIDEEEKKIDCYHRKMKPADVYYIPDEYDFDPCEKIPRSERKPNTIIGNHMKKLQKNRPNRFFKNVKTPDRSGSPDTVKADIYNTPANFEGGGRKKTRRRRKKKSKRKKTRRRRKKKKTRRKKKKKRKKSKRKKRSRKLRGGNYWTFNPDTKKYECYITVNHKGSKKHSFGKVARFDSLTKFTRHMCKNYDKKIPGLIQHPKILNKDDPELTIIKDRRKGADNSGIYIYQYRCGFCGKIITYNDRREKSIHFKDWDFTNPPSPDKKKQNFDKFNEYIKKQRKEEQSINDGRGRSSSAHNFEYVEVSPNVYNKDELYEYDPNDDNW